MQASGVDSIVGTGTSSGPRHRAANWNQRGCRPGNLQTGENSGQLKITKMPLVRFKKGRKKTHRKSQHSPPPKDVPSHRPVEKKKAGRAAFPNSTNQGEMWLLGTDSAVINPDGWCHFKSRRCVVAVSRMLGFEKLHHPHHPQRTIHQLKPDLVKHLKNRPHTVRLRSPDPHRPRPRAPDCFRVHWL